ncbi:MAG: hypothetical protein WBA22_00140 [Candidatus Methanofastidiosia archaeon]
MSNRKWEEKELVSTEGSVCGARGDVRAGYHMCGQLLRRDNSALMIPVGLGIIHGLEAMT